jgi:hypothetical protein
LRDLNPEHDRFSQAGRDPALELDQLLPSAEVVFPNSPDYDLHVTLKDSHAEDGLTHHMPNTCA